MINANILKKGEFVPSIRNLAEDLGVNINTVARAYRELTIEGVLEPVRGEGYIVRKLNRDEFTKQILSKLELQIESCKKAGISFEELYNLLERIYWRDKNDPES